MTLKQYNDRVQKLETAVRELRNNLDSRVVSSVPKVNYDMLDVAITGLSNAYL